VASGMSLSFSCENRKVLLSETAFETLCNAMSKCSSLHTLGLEDCPVQEEHLEKAAKTLAIAIEQSTSWERLVLHPTNNCASFMGLVHHALLCTKSVKNFDLCCQQFDDDEGVSTNLEMCRVIPWKRVLSQNIQLELWPWILAKTSNCYEDASHTSLDALFFLMREKNDVLLQNVRKHCIRKRKQFQISS